MNLLNGLLGALGGASSPAGQGANPLLQVALSLLAGGGQGASQTGSALGGLGGLGGLAGLAGLAGGGSAQGAGGLGALIETFTRNGLGEQAQSWIGTGQNLPISADQLQQVLGGDLLSDIARQLGTSPQEASSGLADLLPQLIDQLTPQGRLPDTGIGDVASIMAMLGRRS